MARSLCLTLGLVGGLAGCGSTIGAFDELPPGPDVSAEAWPRLVETPEPPEARMNLSAGERALERLTAQRSSAGARKIRADALAPVSDSLVARLPEVAARKARADSVQPVSDTLLDRAAAVQARAANAPAGFNDQALLARPVPLRPLDQPTVSAEFEERARRARERAARAGS